MADTIAQDKESIWIHINEEISHIWPSIQIIFEQGELLARSNILIAEVKIEIDTKPSDAVAVIKTFNSKNKYELEELDIEDRTDNIL